MRIVGKIYRFIRHWITATNTKGHGIHSPYLFHFVENIIYDTHPFYIFKPIEKRRKALLQDDTIIFQKDFGTGKSKHKKISKIAQKSLKKKYWGQLLFRIIHFSESKTILELGTSLGITTSYLSTARKSAECTTLEGSEEITKIAKETLNSIGRQNVKVVVGDIDKTLPKVLEDKGTLDFVFFDANHEKEPVLNYFNQCLKHTDENSIFVFDDIHWSKGMQKAWSEICNNNRVSATLDLYEIGIVFFKPDLPKHTFKLRGRII